MSHEDGDKIELSDGWYLLLDGSTREEGQLQGFVQSPDGGSASLAFARANGTTSDELEEQIPENVMAELNLHEYDEFE